MSLIFILAIFKVSIYLAGIGAGIYFRHGLTVAACLLGAVNQTATGVQALGQHVPQLFTNLISIGWLPTAVFIVAALIYLLGRIGRSDHWYL